MARPKVHRLGFLASAVTLIGTGVVSIITGTAIPILVGVGVSSIVTAGSLRSRRPAVAEPGWRTLDLTPDVRARVERLDQRREQIEQAARANRRFSGGLLRDEIDKLRDIVLGFAQLASARARWQRTLAAADVDDLESELRRAESDAQRALDDDKRALARQQVAILEERRTQLAEMRKKIANAASELDLMENCLKLVAEKVMSIDDPAGVRAELDNLMTGVDAVREVSAPAAGRRQAT